ncbi:MAG: class I SAM-dependent methyltransferase [Gemmatimonadaceae bacterium]|nr:class I SAM-dependent methyltransferase [Gemmatimonadaceae bacterium]
MSESTEPRNRITDHAIVAAILARTPSTVLDLGCGDGWLCRALAPHRIRALGVDVVDGLIDAARMAGTGEFRVASYESIAAGELMITVDVAVANFSLLDTEATEGVVAAVPALLRPGGAFVIQTLHPDVAADDRAEVRTRESWKAMLMQAGFREPTLIEPVIPKTGRPASLILVAEPR